MFLALSAALVFGCKKDNEPDSSATSATVKANLSRTWQAQTVKGIPGGSGSFGITVYTRGGGSANLINDLANFFVTFKQDGTFERSSLDTPGAVESGTWTLASDNKTITMKSSTGATLTYVADPVKATNATFKYTINVKNPTGLDLQIVQKAAAMGSTLPEGSTLNFEVIPK